MLQKEYVILLPLRFNDGNPVPDELVLQTREELVRQFGGASLDPGTVTGYWMHEQSQFTDELIRVRISGTDAEVDDAFIQEYKEILKTRFQRHEIYIAGYVIERF